MNILCKGISEYPWTGSFQSTSDLVSVYMHTHSYKLKNQCCLSLGKWSGFQRPNSWHRPIHDTCRHADSRQVVCNKWYALYHDCTFLTWQTDIKSSGTLQFNELAIGETETQSRDADNTTSNIYNSSGYSSGYSSGTARYGGGIQPTTSSYDLVTQEATGMLS